MKSFKAFLAEAKNPSTWDGWLKAFNAASLKKSKLMDTSPPAVQAKARALWDKTWWPVSDACYKALDQPKSRQKPPTDAQIQKFTKARDKWDAEWPEIVAKVKEKLAKQNLMWDKEKDPCKRLFQKTVFAEVGGLEQDTAKEAEIWQQVANYVSSPENHGVVKKAYAELLKCKGSYSVLEPGVKQVYRGINVTLKTALRLVNITKLTDKKSSLSAKVGPKQMIGHATKYSPLHSVESWSANPSVAYNFAKGDGGGGFGYYEFSLPELRRAVKDLQRLILKQQKLQNKPKKDEFDKDDLYTVKDDIAYTIQDQINNYLSSDSPVPVVYQIVPDKYCVMNPLFSNKIGNIVGVGAEAEVTRIETTSADATVWIPQEVIDGAMLVAEIQELIKQAKVKTPAIKVAVPVKLKKGK